MSARVWAALIMPAVAIAAAGCAPSIGAESPTAVEVVAVVDGDTIRVLTDDGEERVRLIGLDAPELGRGGAVDECYAAEATAFLNDLLYGELVELTADPTQDDRDRWGRMLRHVFVDGESAAVAAIAGGYAVEYTYNVPYEGHAEHVRAEDAAQAAGAGLWGHC